MNELNCWIDRDGRARRVLKGQHAVERTSNDVVRVSLPERRRTWAGIAVKPPATREAVASLLQVVADLHADGIAIRAELKQGEIIEVQPHDRLTELNRKIRELV